MNKTATIYRGDSFAYAGQASGLPNNDFTGYTISARIGRRPGCLDEPAWAGEDLVAEWDNIATGAFTVSGPTSAWPLGLLALQLRLSTGGLDSSSTIIHVPVEERV